MKSYHRFPPYPRQLFKKYRQRIFIYFEWLFWPPGLGSQRKRFVAKSSINKVYWKWKIVSKMKKKLLHTSSSISYKFSIKHSFVNISFESRQTLVWNKSNSNLIICHNTLLRKTISVQRLAASFDQTHRYRSWHFYKRMKVDQCLFVCLSFDRIKPKISLHIFRHLTSRPKILWDED